MLDCFNMSKLDLCGVWESWKIVTWKEFLMFLAILLWIYLAVLFNSDRTLTCINRQYMTYNSERVNKTIDLCERRASPCNFYVRKYVQQSLVNSCKWHLGPLFTPQGVLSWALWAGRLSSWLADKLRTYQMFATSTIMWPGFGLLTCQKPFSTNIELCQPCNGKIGYLALIYRLDTGFGHCMATSMRACRPDNHSLLIWEFYEKIKL